MKAQVLQIVRASKNGVSLSAIARKLNRDLAAVVLPVTLLMEAGLVEKQAQLYRTKERTQ